MSDGGEESKREIENNPDDYGRAVAKVAVSQICEGLGFEAVKQSALEALSDIVVQYVCDLGKSASLYANLAGRSEVNLFDILKGLEDFESNAGFSGSSKGDHCVVKEMYDFFGTLEETPFALPIPRFPMVKRSKRIPTFSQMGEEPNGKHIPSWLPAFPDSHTYIHSPMWNERKTDPRTDKVDQVKQRRKAERSLLSLQQRLLSNGLAGPSDSNAGTDLVEANKIENNQFGEEEVSAIVLPSKVLVAQEEEETKQISVVDTFSRAIDGLKGSELDSMDLDQKVVSERRPVVNFRLNVGRKMLVEDLDVNLRSRMNGRKSAFAGRDDDKDDKKKRAEQILRVSMETQQEMSQM